jgi:H+/Na+-translocating ferredoxin:NAD+ oxidoreductase subunit B
MPSPQLVEAIEQLLPQTQCQRCGYQGCHPYAQAIAAGEAEINRCPPGGSQGIRQLSALLGRQALALDPSCGFEGPLALAQIDEARCIGCAICIDACPVDAIVGAARQMHTVVEVFCTGCELCVAPCPVDCIAMVPASPSEWTRERAAASRARFEARTARRAREELERASRLAERKASLAGVGATSMHAK